MGEIETSLAGLQLFLVGRPDVGRLDQCGLQLVLEGC